MAVRNGRSAFSVSKAKYRKGSDLFEPDLEDRVIQKSSTSDEEDLWLIDEEFLQNYRILRKFLW
jgi:hypothetical protein